MHILIQWRLSLQLLLLQSASCAMDTHDIKVHHAEGLEKDIKTSELYSRIFLLESCLQNANEIFPAYIIAVDGEPSFFYFQMRFSTLLFSSSFV